MKTSHLIRRLGALTASFALVGTLAACATEGSNSAAEPAVSAAPAVDANESHTMQVPRLSADSAMAAAQAALDQCRADGVGFVTVAVVDRYGQVQALLRGDGAAAHTIDAATQKGYTAAAWGVNTSELAQRVNDGAQLLRDLDGTLFLPGGVPIKLGNANIAGIGVGGAPDGMVDEGCATAGALILTEEANAS
ncbi:heme-binding protein [Lysinibacter sp. HNR]|uniref:GlcG/HbpS family heme-binding protein n=1 Tax=Lysinibacter sp. HNR TaxID=3031408 RepID=UPI002435C7DF|nr:heme-binding protein [Lysinibacter sp. HNR]WGD37165.1 heme-binding protein [Lysinibacter sp. HNR]